MTQKEYLRALKRLSLSPASKRTAQVLGVGLRQLARYSAGDAQIPQTLELLLEMYLRHGLPRGDRP
jgi:hypothetical protein